MEYLLGGTLVVLLAILAVFAWPSVVCPWLEGRAWRRLADRAGLTYRRSRVLGIPRRGRVVGSYRGRDLTLDTYRDLGLGLRMRILLSVRNPIGGSMLICGLPWTDREDRQVDGRGDRPFTIAQSEPGDLAAKVFAAADLHEGMWSVVQEMRVRDYRIDLSDYVLRFEQEPRTFCFLSVERQADRLQALLDVLCNIAEAAEEVIAR